MVQVDLPVITGQVRLTTSVRCVYGGGGASGEWYRPGGVLSLEKGTAELWLSHAKISKNGGVVQSL